MIQRQTPRPGKFAKLPKLPGSELRWSSPRAWPFMTLFCHCQPASPAGTPASPFRHLPSPAASSACLVPFLPALWKFLPAAGLGSNPAPGPSKQTYPGPPTPLFQPIWHSMDITVCVYVLAPPFSWVLWRWSVCPAELHSRRPSQSPASST